MKLYLKKDEALGYGTRAKGTFVGETTAEDLLSLSADNSTSAPGLRPEEWLCLLENPQLLTGEAPALEPFKEFVESYEPEQPTVPPVDPFAELQSEVFVEKESVPEFSPETLSQSVDSLDVPRGTKKKLVAAGLKTIQEVLDYADGHDGLSTVEGLTSEEEEKIVASLAILSK